MVVVSASCARITTILFSLLFYASMSDCMNASWNENLSNSYEILGVSPDASDEEIIKAWREQARYLHPDKNKAPDATEKFQVLQNAYETIHTQENRRRYNVKLCQTDCFWCMLFQGWRVVTPLYEFLTCCVDPVDE